MGQHCRLEEGAALRGALAAGDKSPAPHHPTITISQGVAAGAAIGGVAGISAILLAEGLRNTDSAIGNPVVAGLGMVLAGLAAGAAFAKFDKFDGEITPTKVRLKVG